MNSTEQLSDYLILPSNTEQYFGSKDRNEAWIAEAIWGHRLERQPFSALLLEFLGMAGLHNTSAAEPEMGIWIKESQHGYGYGQEAVAAVISFAARDLGKRAFVYPVVERNGSSRRLAESLGGSIVGSRLLRKADGVEHPEVVYRIPAPTDG